MKEGFGHWGFSILILLTGLVELYLDRKSYRALDIKNLPNLSMTNATENVTKHKLLIKQTNKILILPSIVLVVWAILIITLKDHAKIPKDFPSNTETFYESIKTAFTSFTES